MSRRNHIVKDDTQVALTAVLTDKNTRQPIDVSGGAVVNMYMRLENGDGTILATVVATKLPARLLEDGTLDTTVVENGAAGRVQFALPIEFTGLDPGLYEGEIEITYEGGLIQTVYEVVKFSIRADF